MSEKDHQITVVDWFNAEYPQYKGCLIAIPNAQVLSYMGSKARIARMYNSLIRQGMKPGASDLFLAVPTQDFHGAWIEMKDEGKTKCSVSQAQLNHLDLMAKMGYFSVWCAGSKEAIKTIAGYIATIKN